MRKNIVAGNWKMNKTLQEGIALAKELNEALAGEKPNCDVIICTPFIHLASVTPLVDAAKIGVGAENCADKESGAYTGEVSAAMVASTGAKYVILGHSERRAYYGETVEILEEKVKLALANGLTPFSVSVKFWKNVKLTNRMKWLPLSWHLYSLCLQKISLRLSWLTNRFGLLVQARPLHRRRRRKSTLSSVRRLKESMVRKSLKTALSFTVVAASPPMQRNCLQILM